jgi:hypothetical protein
VILKLRICLTYVPSLVRTITQPYFVFNEMASSTLRKRSPLWKYFNVEEDNSEIAICLICAKEIPRKDANTKGMRDCENLHNRLLPENVDMLLFLKCNIAALDLSNNELLEAIN